MDQDLTKLLNMFAGDVCDYLEKEYQIPVEETKTLWKKIKTRSRKKKKYDLSPTVSYSEKKTVQQKEVPGVFEFDGDREAHYWRIYEKLKVNQLRDMCERFGLETSINRVHMINQLVRHRILREEEI